MGQAMISYLVLGKPNINVPNCRSQCAQSGCVGARTTARCSAPISSCACATPLAKFAKLLSWLTNDNQKQTALRGARNGLAHHDATFIPRSQLGLARRVRTTYRTTQQSALHQVILPILDSAASWIVEIEEYLSSINFVFPDSWNDLT